MALTNNGRDITNKLQKDPITENDYVLYDDLNEETLDQFIKLHTRESERLKDFKNQYEGRPPIVFEKDKESWKPDNRLIANFGKYIVDTFNGYFTGIPVKVSHDNDEIDYRIQTFWNSNNLDDLVSELSKLTSIYGKAYLYMYQDENSNTSVSIASPLDTFLIYSSDIRHTPIYGVRWTNANEKRGVLISSTSYIEFYYDSKNQLKFGDEKEHYFNQLPIIEFVENREKLSLIAPVETLINAFNQTLSEKANDTDYFADAYLKVLGVEIEDDASFDIRDSRIINLFSRGGGDLKGIDVGFLEKPDGDTTQENLLNRLEDLIYRLSMVANINDESYGNASGTALEFKLQPMKNLAKMKERKYVTSLNKMFEIFLGIESLKISRDIKDEWVNINYKFTLNMPRNVESEADAVQKLNGTISDETLLSLLSFIDNPKQEIEKMKEEQEENMPRGSTYITDRGMQDES